MVEAWSRIACAVGLLLHCTTVLESAWLVRLVHHCL